MFVKENTRGMLENQTHAASLNSCLVPHRQAHFPFHLGEGYPSN